MAENRWRKIEVRMWGDDKFRALSSLQPSGQALWAFLLTGPHTSSIPGLFRAGRAALAEELGWSLEAFDKAFQEVFAKGMAKADWEARVVFIPKAPKCNPPQSTNVVKAWATEWRLIPDCDLKREAYQALKSAACNLSKAYKMAFDKAFDEASIKALPIQEQEQEQDKSQIPPTPFFQKGASKFSTRDRRNLIALIDAQWSPGLNFDELFAECCGKLLIDPAAARAAVGEEALRLKRESLGVDDGECRTHPDSGLTQWGTCWGCYSDRFRGDSFYRGRGQQEAASA